MPANKTDRKFMEMAVAEMRKSRSEHASDRDPMVGAVLVGKGLRLLGATHRGGLRVGDHAEFTLIERYHAGARAHVLLKESEVEIRSPGGLLKPLSLTRVRTFNAPPYSRNPHMALAIHRMGWIEEKGSGLGRMRDSMLGHGLRPPAFDFRDGYFIVSLPAQAQTWSNVRVSPHTLAALEGPQRKLVELVLASGRIGTKAAATNLRVNVATARRHLSALAQRGVLATHGKGPRLSYQLAGSE